MPIPESVRIYNEAQWWYFLHLGVPTIIIVFAAYVVMAWREYRQDTDFSEKSENENPLRITPKV